MNKITLYYFLIFICLAAGCSGDGSNALYNIEKSAASLKGMVVTAHPLATQAGVEILRKGGNAADAAIAVQFALAVVHPRAGNIGGGGFLVYRDDNGKIYTHDFREKAPAAAHKDMFVDSMGEIIPGLSQHGILAIGVPGSVAGMVETHNRLGNLRWAALLEPAIRLALRGFRITEAEANRLNENREIFLKYNSTDIPFLAREIWYEGDKLIQKDLAVTLQTIANEGRKGFYSGQNAKFLLDAMKHHNGLITQQDLDEYVSVWREPMSIKWRDLTIHTMSLPSSGGIILKQILGMIDDLLMDSRNVNNVHLIVEAERRAFADRATYLGDPEFYHVPVDSIASEVYLSSRFADYDSTMASISGTPDSALFYFSKENYETTHFSIVDGDGNATSVTTTLNGNYGSKIWVPGGGYFLNNEMDDFSAKPGYPNLYGLIGAEANEIQPHKRMLSSMTPAIVEKDSNLFMVLGSPGGSTIPTTVLQVILNHAFFRMTIGEAVQSPRYHHQWLPDEIIYEEGAFTEDQKMILQHMNHRLRQVHAIGEVNAIAVDAKAILNGSADRRGDNHAQGL